MTLTKKISFRIVAYTDAAGKYNPDIARSGNEDNFYVDDDLTDSLTSRVSQDETIQLGSLGMLMAVADGMGGMNAGEVASQIAIDTIMNAFKAEELSKINTSTSSTRQKYLEQVIKCADKNIKKEAKNDINKEGMGSTIILAWLYDNKLTISWCGDSRAYIYNDKSGIRLISQDHSYVQELVNKGLLTYEQTFDHPQNNIVTRSLGDPTKDAKPESRTLDIGKGDIILLCSDGLSGVLRDRKTYTPDGMLYQGDNMEDIIRANTSSMKQCREALWQAAERGGWYDNVTVILCQVMDGPESKWATPQIQEKKSGNIKRKAMVAFALALVLLSIISAYFLGRHSQPREHDGHTANKDTISISNDSDEVNVGDNVQDSNLLVIDNVKQKDEDGVGEKKEKEEKTTKPTIREQVIQKVENKVDTSSNHSNGLTRIIKKEEQADKTNKWEKFTPVQSDMPKGKTGKSNDSEIPKEEKQTNNPINSN